MYFPKLLGALLCCVLALPSFAQEKFTISGYLRDAETGEELLFGTVSVPESGVGVVTNEYGYYALTLEAGTHIVNYAFVGYESVNDTIELTADLRNDVELQVAANEVEEVIVTDERTDENVRSTEMSVVSLDMKEAKLIPVIFGEQDILKTIQLMPGVSPGSEGGSGFFVRGGDADQNLILLDEAPVYNASHLLGFFSVFNSDAIKDVKLYKGGIPAQYGGRISSVLDVRMKNGNTKKWSVTAGLGLISSRATIEGPLVKDKGSIIISGRRTYADIMAQIFSNDFDGGQLFFYDLNAKANYKLGLKDRIYASGYFGRDVFGFEGNGLDWGNATLTLRWNHIFNDKLFANTTFFYSDYNYGFNIAADNVTIDLGAGIQDFNLQQDYSWYLNPKNNIQFGWRALYHNFEPGFFEVVNAEDEVVAETKLAQQFALENAIYMGNQQKVSDRLSLNYGIRFSSFSNIGPYEVKEYNEEDEIVNRTNYVDGDFYNNYFGIEPRANAVFLLDDHSSVKGSYNRTYQYLHLLSNSNSGSPTDIWIPSTPLIKPEYGDQVAVGYFRNFLDNQLEFSVEGFYKFLGNQVDYEDGATTFLNEDLEAELVFGTGRSYGGEFFLRKRKGKFTGWIAYTLLWSKRKYDEIADGAWISARQDRRHDLSLVATYQIHPRVNIAATFIYYTGDAVTFPTGKYEIDGQVVNLYSSRNGDRMPDYHRMDLGVTWTVADKKHWFSDLNFSIYNLYNRKNAFSITFRESTTNPNTTEAVKLALFGIVPSITWNFQIK